MGVSLFAVSSKPASKWPSKQGRSKALQGMPGHTGYPALSLHSRSNTSLATPTSYAGLIHPPACGGRTLRKAAAALQAELPLYRLAGIPCAVHHASSMSLTAEHDHSRQMPKNAQSSMRLPAQLQSCSSSQSCILPCAGCAPFSLSVYQHQSPPDHTAVCIAAQRSAAHCISVLPPIRRSQAAMQALQNIKTDATGAICAESVAEVERAMQAADRFMHTDHRTAAPLRAAIASPVAIARPPRLPPARSYAAQERSRQPQQLQQRRSPSSQPIPASVSPAPSSCWSAESEEPPLRPEPHMGAARRSVSSESGHTGFSSPSERSASPTARFDSLGVSLEASDATRARLDAAALHDADAAAATTAPSPPGSAPLESEVDMSGEAPSRGGRASCGPRAQDHAASHSNSHLPSSSPAHGHASQRNESGKPYLPLARDYPPAPPHQPALPMARQSSVEGARVP